MRGVGRKSGRGRPKGRGRGCEKEDTEETDCSDSYNSFLSSKDLHILSSPAPFSRYPTTRSRAAIAQCSTLRSPLRSPVRCVRKTPQQPPNIQAEYDGANSGFSVTEKNTVYVPTNFGESEKGKNVVVGNSASAGSNCSAANSKHDLDLDKIISQCQRGPSEVEKIGPPTSDDNVRDKSHCLSRADSTNITEFAKKLQSEQEDDPDEVESALDPAFDYVNTYKVKKGIAPLLKSVFYSHGDITSGSDTKSNYLRTIYLERVCEIYTRLEHTSFFGVTGPELDDMLVEVGDLEHQKVNVGWLREKIAYIHQAKINLGGYLEFKEEAKKNDESIGSLEKELEAYRREVEDYKRDVSVLQHKVSLREQRISAAEEELAAKKAKADHSKQMTTDIRERVISLKNQSLVHGLLKAHET